MMSVLKSGKAVKFLVMVDQRDFIGRNSKFNQLVKTINDVFGSEETALRNSSSIALVLNSIPSIEEQVDKKLVADQLYAFMQDQKHQDKCIFREDNILIFDPVDDIKTRDKIFGKIENMHPIINDITDESLFEKSELV